MKYHVFGCSLSHGIWWDQFIDAEFNVQAIPAGDNTTQCRRFQDEVLDNKISNMDFVIWQVTYPSRLGFRLRPGHHFIKTNPGHNNFHQANRNLLDNQSHVDYVAFNEEWYKTFYQVENINQELQNLLFHLKMAANITKGKLLVWFAQHDMMARDESKNFVSWLQKEQIEYVEPAQSIMTWCKTAKKQMDEDQLHPTPESYKIYVKNILEPKINEIIKRNI